jgi:hypothetical protein
VNSGVILEELIICERKNRSFSELALIPVNRDPIGEM